MNYKMKTANFKMLVFITGTQYGDVMTDVSVKNYSDLDSHKGICTPQPAMFKSVF